MTATLLNLKKEEQELLGPGFLEHLSMFCSAAGKPENTSNSAETEELYSLDLSQ